MSGQCDRLRTLLSGYRDGELSTDEAQSVEQHLADCADCRAALVTDERIETVLTEDRVARSETEWEALSQRVERAVAKEAAAAAPPPVSTGGAWRRFMRSLTPPRVAFGTVGTLAAAALIFLLQPWQEELVPDPDSVLSQTRAPEIVPKAVEEVAKDEDEAPVPAAAPRDRLRALGDLAETDDQAVVARDTRSVANQPPPASSPVPEPRRELGSRSVYGVAPLASDAPTEVDFAREKVVITAGRQPTDAADRKPVSSGLMFEPAAPARGASSLQDVSDWYARGNEPEEGRTSGFEMFSEKKTMRVQSPEAGAGAGGKASDADLLPQALARASAWVSQGDVEPGREGLTLLTGDFEGNEVREEAWITLIDLESNLALGSRRPSVVLPIALSIDAFLEAYPESESAELIRNEQARVWGHLASIDPETFCPAALQRAPHLRDGPCAGR